MAVLQRIAVADDEQIIRDFYCKVLRRSGLSVVVIAADGQQLVEGCRLERPDLIICDVRMPNLDGLTALRRIADFHPTPAIVISALNRTETLPEDGDPYVLAFRVKPVDMWQLKSAVDDAEQKLQSEAWRRPAHLS